MPACTCGFGLSLQGPSLSTGFLQNASSLQD